MDNGKNGPQTIVTGLTENRNEFIWKIENWKTISSFNSLLRNQRIHLHAPCFVSCPAKWEVGLRQSSTGKEHVYTYYCTLLDNRPDRPELAAKFEIRFPKEPNCPGYSKMMDLKIGETIELDEVHINSVAVGIGHFRRPSYLDEDGSLVQAITLTIYDSYGNIKDISKPFDDIYDPLD